jgi:hypothetical protein
MYQYGNQAKEQERQLKQVAKNLQRAQAKRQQAGTKAPAPALPEGAATPERTVNENE